MVIGHFFLRTIKKRRYLMCQTSCSAGSKSPWSSSPVVVLETNPGESAIDWTGRAMQAIKEAHPDHVPGDISYINRSEPSDVQTFDIALKQPVHERKPGLLRRLIG